jgi:hypothetical protein
MMLPRRLKRPKLGVQVPPGKIWPRHRRWVKSHGCCVPGCDATVVDFAHLRSASNAGMHQKPHDIFGVSLCRQHHIEQHSLGIDAFDRKYGTDLWALAAEFARRSPDAEMRATLKLVSAEDPSRRPDALVGNARREDAHKPSGL